MAPKQAKPDKAKQAQKAKAVEDKTFGLKNKNKSAKVQKFVEQMQKSAQPQVNPRLAPPSAKDKKKAEEERARELASLFAVAIKQPKVPPGVDPKSIVCEYFRAGQCTKGFKCKYSHDLNVERKSAKIDLFTDQRTLGEKEEGMEEWDQAQLEAAIAQKHGAENKNNPTAIICKFFLNAVEGRQYGWFWKCPNGSECKYRHALPPGYILKSQMKELLEEAAANVKDAAEIIEEERAKLDAKTPITEEVFRKWHSAKLEEKRKAREAEAEERRKKGLLNGREIFLQEGFVAQDDAGAAGEYDREDDEEAAINKMFQDARDQAAAARAAADAGPSEAAAAGTSVAGPSSGAGPSTTLTAEDAAELFDDSDDDEDIEDDDPGDDDDDDEMLESLEQGIKSAHV